MCFRRLLCVRLKIEQIYCMNCWVIIHCFGDQLYKDKCIVLRACDLIFFTIDLQNSELILNNSLLETIYFLIISFY